MLITFTIMNAVNVVVSYIFKFISTGEVIVDQNITSGATTHPQPASLISDLQLNWVLENSGIAIG